MLSISRYCRNIKIISRVQSQRTLFQNITKNVLNKNKAPFFKGNALSTTLKVTFLRCSGSTAVRYNSNVSRKGKQFFSSWLFNRKGVILIGVLLVLATGYYFVLLSICIVLDEVIKKTVK